MGSQESASALELALARAPGISALAADTASTAARASQPMRPAPPLMRRRLAGVRHLDAKNFLHNNDATSFFEAAGGLIVRGPTHSNVNDFRIILVDA